MMEAFLAGLCVLVIIWLLVLGANQEPMSDEDRAKQAYDLEKKEKELARIYWHTSEIYRISDLKTKAIKSGDMETYKALCTEKDNLDRLYKVEFPNV